MFSLCGGQMSVPLIKTHKAEILLLWKRCGWWEPWSGRVRTLSSGQAIIMHRPCCEWRWSAPATRTEQGGAQHPQWMGSQCLVLWSRDSPVPNEPNVCAFRNTYDRIYSDPLRKDRELNPSEMPVERPQCGYLW